MRDNKGFTLIELLITISILSMILFIPMLKANMVLNYKERQELKEFKNDLCYARNNAIVESTRYSVMLRPDTNSYIIFKHRASALKEIVKNKEFTNGIKIKTTNIKGHEIIFNYSGAPLISGTIYLEDKKRNPIEITITPATGKVNVYLK